MTDMRATERLLEVIGDLADRIIAADPDSYSWDCAREIELASAELRRRGDTLVRADDLRQLLVIAEQHNRAFDFEPFPFQERLENALGGKML